MDSRTPLENNTVLHFPGMECRIESCSGRGSNVIAYTGRYRDHLNPALSHPVLIRELFPYDPQGRIRREDDGSIRVDPSAEHLYAFNRMTFLRGNEVHIRLTESIPSEIDMHINTFACRNTLYSLVGYTGGRTLAEELGREQRVKNPVDTGFFTPEVCVEAPQTSAGSHRRNRQCDFSSGVSAQKRFDMSEREKNSGAAHTEAGLFAVIRRIRGALQVLQSFHDAGYLHLDVSPDNLLLVGKGEKERVTLIDYNSVHTMDELLGQQNIYYSLKDGYTAPEVRMGQVRRIGPWTDLYSVAAVLYRCLAGTGLSPLQMVEGGGGLEGMEQWPLLRGCPETAVSMLRRILQGGLAVVWHRRYRSASQMLVDLEELEDRMRGRGITHWALWEAGRRRIRRSLRENPSLHYILDRQKLYPLRAESKEGQRISLAPFFRTGLSDREPHAPVLLLGGGGMGKTTALYRIACEQEKHYRPLSPAVYYISLYGYRGGKGGIRPLRPPERTQ